MKRLPKYIIPDILIPELKNLEIRLDKSIKIYENNINDIDKSISFVDAINLIDMGIDVTQLKIKR